MECSLSAQRRVVRGLEAFLHGHKIPGLRRTLRRFG
jgi:hypothetical protein